ncbi:MAG: dihydroorotase [Deltaproteobacteria bacterium]|nr:dihydroorotase [Deltaproteobacteria bacterium]
MAIRIIGGRIIDPARNVDEIGDIVISGDTIANLGSVLADDEIIDASGLWVVPGLIDAHVHLREPGQKHKESIATGLQAAAAGGFTATLPMPNTEPANDSPKITRTMIEKARELGGTRIFPVSCVTVGRRGEQLAPFSKLCAAGAVAFSDDGSAVEDDEVMEQALEQCRVLKKPISQHAEDPAFSKGGALHQGEVSKRLGISGWPAEAEERIVSRDIALCEKTGAHVHVQHISTRGAVELVRQAKARGLAVTAEVTPHHLHLTDEAAVKLGALAKVNPPLREVEDVKACREALVDGTIDIIATDHAPHTLEDKEGGLEKAAFGMVGLETAVPLILLLVERGILTPARMVEAMSTMPARIFNLPGGTLAANAVADVTLIDPAAPHTIDPASFRSKGRNTPFGGWKVPGRAVRTIVNGKTIQR